jgi:selenocysteine lyase/cysteine desulfurase
LINPAAVLAISWVQYFNGYRYDLEQMADLCHRHDCLVLLDAIQGVGALQIDVQASGVDALACGAQKWLFGQTGSGFLYISPNPVRAIQPSYQGWLSVDWGYRFEELQDAGRSVYTDGRRWEIGTYPFFAIRLSHAGLSILTEAGHARIWDSIQAVLDRIETGLAGSGYGLLRFPDAANRSGIGVLSGPRCRELHQHLAARQIHTSFREGNIRVSPHFHNTEDEADRLTEAVREFENRQ